MSTLSDHGETLCDQMNDLSDARRRSTPLAFLHALPAIILLAGYLWLAVAIVVWTLTALFFANAMWAMVAVFALSAPGSIFLTIRIVTLAVEAER